MGLHFLRTLSCITMFLAVGCAVPGGADVARAADMPAMRWDHRPEARDWTQATLTALTRQGATLSKVVPSDVDTFCPAYADGDQRQRQAFWAGFLSALAKHESTWDPKAMGGGGRWVGLMQIAPKTAKAFDCAATDREALTNGRANLACAVRIAAAEVGRDGAIVSGASGWRGVARHWAPLRAPTKRADIARWTRAQSYCTLTGKS